MNAGVGGGREEQPSTRAADDGTIDAHHHFWRLADGGYRWIKDRLDLPGMRNLDRDFEPPELRAILGRAGVARTLLVQTECTTVETDRMLEYARCTDFVAGVVGWVDVAAPDGAKEVRRRAADPLIKGLRVWMLTAEQAERVTRPVADDAIVAAASAALPLELLAGPGQLDAMLRLVERRDLQSVALCHAGKPAVGLWRPGDEDFGRWTAGVTRLAERGCRVKLSGLMTECGPDWRIDMLAPYVEVLLGAFGPARIMWGSDWPVINRAGGYAKWLEAVRVLTRDMTSGERSDVFGGTAARFYRLADHRSPRAGSRP